ncbi:MAG: carboxypeptidase regulatory-like domain-containing protein [Planctomycetota bacterium]
MTADDRTGGGESESEARAVVTDEEGRFLVAPGPGADARIRFELARHLPCTVAPLQIPRGEGAFLEVHLAVWGSLDVEVVDADGAPVGGAELWCAPPRSLLSWDRAPRELASVQREGVTDGAGFCRLEEVPCGTTLAVSTDWAFGPDLPKVEIDPAVGRARLRIVREPRGSIAGSVLNADGDPAAVRVQMRRFSESGVRRETRADADGRYRFADLPPGDVVVAPAACGLEGVDVTVRAGEELVLAPFRIPELAPLAGWLRTRWELDPSLLSIELRREGEPVGARLFPDAEGRFAAVVPPGSLLLRVLAGSTPYVALPQGGHDRQPGTELGEVARVAATAPDEGREVWIDDRVGVIEGLVGEAAIAGEAPLLFLHSLPVGTAPRFWTAARAFSLRASWIGDGRFRSRPIPAGTYAASVVLGGNEVVYLPEVVVPAGEAIDLGRLGGRWGDLHGIVRDGGGNPVPDATVTFESLVGEGNPAPCVSDLHGRFSVARLTLQRWWVRAEHPRVGKSRPSVVDPIELGGNDLAPGESRDVTLRHAPDRKRLRLLYRGRPVPAGGGAVIVAVGAESEACGTVHFAPVAEGGLVGEGGLSGRLLVWVGHPDLLSGFLWGVAREDDETGPRTVQLGAGEITVEGALGPHAPPPVLRVIRIAGVDLDGLALGPTLLPRHDAGPGRWRFAGVPDDAELRLDGRDATGRRCTRVLSSAEALGARIAWP